MKVFIYAVFGALSLAPTLFAADIRKGETVETVFEKLGRPNGKIDLEDKQFLYYDRGHLEVIGGRVVKVALVSEEAYARNQEAKRLQAITAAQREKVRRANVLEEGQRVKANMLNDPDFVAASATRQLHAWKAFSDKYPGVDIRDELEVVVMRARSEQHIREEQQRIREEQQRLAVLERRAAEAERRALEAEERARRRTVYYSSPGTVVYNNAYRNQHYGFGRVQSGYGGTTVYQSEPSRTLRSSSSTRGGLSAPRIRANKIQLRSGTSGTACEPSRASSVHMYSPSVHRTASGLTHPHNDRSLYQRPGVTVRYSF